MASILLIDDMKGVRESVAMVLSSAGHQVTQAIDGADGLKQVSQGQFDLIITDVLMPNADGIEMLMELKSTGVKTPILAMSGGSPMVKGRDALSIARAHATETILKPFSRFEILEVVERLVPSKA